ncbi:hypothetical protein BT93_H2020 [Corymbia citriodora subsp. variegata]|nr:hypothetical protein BT93_H2020 [Corymbia citriodora subsp. variegata]
MAGGLGQGGAHDGEALSGGDSSLMGKLIGEASRRPKNLQNNCSSLFWLGEGLAQGCCGSQRLEGPSWCNRSGRSSLCNPVVLRACWNCDRNELISSFVTVAWESSSRLVA